MVQHLLMELAIAVLNVRLLAQHLGAGIDDII
jgi:hypothetical protein